MCVINVSSQRYEINAMYFKFGRFLVIFLNLSLIVVICMVLTEFYGVVIFRDGGYTEWSSFSPCTKSCGGGERRRIRKCINPEPSLGGRNCSNIGPSIDVIKCSVRPCPIHGGFEKWSKFSACDKPCGGGIQKRVRYCNNPVPKYGGLDCGAQNMGLYEQNRTCNEKPCSIDGGYTEWEEWSSCSSKCGLGTRTRKRSCTNPEPSKNGKDCTHIGPSTEDNECDNKCAVHGNYGPWGEWSQCSKTCLKGEHSRKRECNNPIPQNGGKTCFEGGHGNPVDSKPCNDHPCQSDGGYSEWSTWTECDKTCDGGRTERRRHCDNPKPVGDGKSCKAQGLGASIEADECNTDPCP